MVPARYKRQEKTALKRVYYTGSDALLPGYALCYDRDEITATDENDDAIGVAAVSWGRHAWVEKPATGNLHNFAGIVAPGSAKTGPGWIDIVEADGHSCEPYTTENCTIAVTHLTVVPASYKLGGVGDGLLVGVALQTLDRSSTNGTIQAILYQPNLLTLPYGLAVPSATARNFSAAIWETCPWNEIVSGAVRGHAYFNDFLGHYDLAANQAITGLSEGISGFTDATGGAIITTPLTDEPYGALQLESTTDNEGAMICTGSGVVGNYVLSSTTKLWMEARFKKLNTTVTKMNVFVGFAEEALVATLGLIANTGELTDKDFVGFHNAEDGGATMDTTWNTAAGATSPVVEGAAAVPLVADTYKNVGMYCNGTTCYFYADGVVLDDSIAIATADFPNGEEMAFYFALLAAHGDLCSAQMDYVRIAQQLA